MSTITISNKVNCVKFVSFFTEEKAFLSLGFIDEGSGLISECRLNDLSILKYDCK